MDSQEAHESELAYQRQLTDRARLDEECDRLYHLT